MKVLVTGANGYLGQGITDKLCKDGHEVIATDFKLNYVTDKAIKVQCNLFEVQEPYEFFGKPDAVLHLAWRDGFIHYSENHLNDLNYHITFMKRLIEGGLKHITVLGSVHEVGFFEGSVNETVKCEPLSYYGIAKNALRQYIQVLSKDKSVVFQWLRGFYIVGNTEHGCSIFSKITAAEKEGKDRFPFTLGLNQFDFIDYNEFCKQVAATISQDKINGIINICTGRPEKLCDRVERFIKENEYSIQLEYGAFPDRPYDSKAIWGDNRKILEIMKDYKEG